MSGSSARGPFEVERLRDKFAEAVEAGGEADVEVTAYCEAYDEICNLLCQLGVVFSFVERDVLGKVSALREKLAAEGKDRALFGELVEAEVTANGPVAQGKGKKKVLHSDWPALFDLTRLHRALDFVIRLIADIHAAEEKESVAHIARAAYAASLSPHHPWVVRQACNVSFFALPSKEAIAHLLVGHLSIPDAERQLREALDFARTVYDRADRLLLHDSRLPHIPQS